MLNIHLPLQNTRTCGTIKIRAHVYMRMRRIKCIALSDTRVGANMCACRMYPWPWRGIPSLRIQSTISKCNPSLSPYAVDSWPDDPIRRDGEIRATSSVDGTRLQSAEIPAVASSLTNYWYTNNIHLGIAAIVQTLRRILVLYAFL